MLRYAKRIVLSLVLVILGSAFVVGIQNKVINVEAVLHPIMFVSPDHLGFGMSFPQEIRTGEFIVVGKNYDETIHYYITHERKPLPDGYQGDGEDTTGPSWGYDYAFRVRAGSEGDFTSDSDVASAVIGCDVCFHLISTTLPKSSNLDPVFDIETNLMGTVRLLNQVVKSGVGKVIFLSSGGTVYGPPQEIPIVETHPTNPICSYGITKLAIEKYLELFYQLHGVDYTVLRLSNPFGERQRIESSQGAVAVFLGKALRGEKIEIWGGENIFLVPNSNRI